MQEYDFTLYYLEGKKNTRADALSRREGEEEKKLDNKDVIVLPVKLFRTIVVEDKERRRELWKNIMILQWQDIPEQKEC